MFESSQGAHGRGDRGEPNMAGRAGPVTHFTLAEPAARLRSRRGRCAQLGRSWKLSAAIFQESASRTISRVRPVRRE